MIELILETLRENSDRISVATTIILSFLALLFSLSAIIEALKVKKKISRDSAEAYKVLIRTTRHSTLMVAVGAVTSIIYTMAKTLDFFGTSSVPTEIWIALGILCITLLCIFFAVRYAPQKLLVTVGAATAFILAALFYEGFITFKSFIEQTSI